jgi:predicted nucleic acid-binding protein
VPAYYFDTSALVKRYHLEQGSERMDQLFADPTATLLTANITLAELTSALDRKRQDGVLTQETLNYVLAAVSCDLHEDFWLIELDRAHVLLSQELILRHHLRTLDALHLAVLLSLHDITPVLVCADQRLLNAAQREQVAVLNPTA